MDICHFVHLFTSWWTFELLSICSYLHNVALNIHIWITSRHVFSFILSVYLEVEFLGHMVGLSLALYGTAKLFSKWLRHCTFALTEYENFSFSTLSPTLGVVSVFYYSHLSRCVVLTHCGLICISLGTLW